MTGEPLDDFDRGILRFEQLWWHHASSKEVAIAEQFGLSPIRYYQCLNTIIDNPAAQAAEPVLVARLQRIRERRRSRIRARTAPTSESPPPR